LLARLLFICPYSFFSCWFYNYTCVVTVDEIVSLLFASVRNSSQLRQKEQQVIRRRGPSQNPQGRALLGLHKPLISHWI
jgi:hypothetical protein